MTSRGSSNASCCARDTPLIASASGIHASLIGRSWP
jgi:hypothetical protein